MTDQSSRSIAAVEAALRTKAPLFRKTVGDREQDFGGAWCDRFEREVATVFEDDNEALASAVAGYGRFSIEAMRLQKKFDQALAYDQGSYADALEEVYLNRSYMQETYLPALLLSHYLWPHHFRQLQWVDQELYPRLRQIGACTFCDVGIGTGFYSKEILAAMPDIRGWGFDVSDASIEYTETLLTKWGLADRYTLCKQEVSDVLGDGFDSFVSVELLEHLEEPIDFLKSLRASVKTGAVGLLTAALDAPNRDHIYLYRSNDEVRVQIESAGFNVLSEACFKAYETTGPETAPMAGCFVVEAI